MNPNDVCEKYADERGDLSLRILRAEEGLNSVLIEGSPRALHLLADLLMAVAGDEGKSRFSLSPDGAGKFHFSEKSELGIYINCLR